MCPSLLLVVFFSQHSAFLLRLRKIKIGKPDLSGESPYTHMHGYMNDETAQTANVRKNLRIHLSHRIPTDIRVPIPSSRYLNGKTLAKFISQGTLLVSWNVNELSEILCLRENEEASSLFQIGVRCLKITLHH